jgi:hypothetical protein
VRRLISRWVQNPSLRPTFQMSGVSRSRSASTISAASSTNGELEQVSASIHFDLKHADGVHVVGIYVGGFLRAWGGTGSNRFDYPLGVAVAPHGQVYVLSDGDPIQKLFVRAGLAAAQEG